LTLPEPDGDADEFYMNIGLNVLLGLPFGAFSALTTPYCLEFFPDAYRGRAALVISLGWPAGSTWCIFLVDSILGKERWRLCMTVGMLVPGIALLITLVFMQESPRWLFTVGRKAEGEAVLIKIFATGRFMRFGGLPTPPVLKEIPPKNDSQESAVKNLKQLFSPDMMRVTILCCLLYATTASASFSGWTHAPNILQQTGGAPVPAIFFAVTEGAGMIGAIIGGMTLDFVGRTKTLLLSYFLGLFAYGLLLTPAANPNTVGYFWLLVGMVQGLMWPALNTYLTEAFPTQLRGTGNGVAATFGRLANIVSPWAVGALLDVNVYAALGLLMSFYVFAAVFALFIPQETKGLALADYLPRSRSNLNNELNES